MRAAVAFDRPLKAAILAVFLAVCASAAAWGLVVFPALTGRVVDRANLLDPDQEAELTTRLKTLEDRTTDQLVVVTVDSLNGRAIEDYSLNLARHWRVGHRDANNGVLLLVAPRERKVRIEVGYGLEGTLTDALASQILEQSVLPHFRRRDFAGGISAGVDDIISVLEADPAEAAARAEEARHFIQASRPAPLQASIGMLCFALIVAGFGVPLLLYIFGFISLPDPNNGWTRYSSGGWSGGSGGGGAGGGGFSGGGGGFGGGGASGGW